MARTFIYEIGDMIYAEENPFYTHGGVWVDDSLLYPEVKRVYDKNGAVFVHRHVTPELYKELKKAIMEGFDRQAKEINAK